MSITNTFSIIGYIGKDPETQTTTGGQAYVRLNVALTRRYTTADGEKREKTDWVYPTFFGPVVRFIENYVRTGSQVAINGQLRTTSFESRDRVGDDGKPITETRLGLVGREIQLLGKREDSAKENNGYAETPQSGNFEDDIPF